jgi:hypothetical protein
MLAHDLPHRRIVDEGRRLIDFAHGCRQTISPHRWALVGEAGRFSDPLYSPGSDLISLYNQLIVDAIQATSDEALEERAALAERIQRVMYEAYLPTYAQTYDCLGDQEAFTLKYTWELTVYFGFYVFPLVNNLMTNTEFMQPFLRRFAVLGPLNGSVQRMLSAFFQWKKRQPARADRAPRFIDFMEMAPLREAERLFYEVGLPPHSALGVVDRQLERLQEFARYIVTHVHASVLGAPQALTNAPFIRSLAVRDARFDPAEMAAAYQRHAGAAEVYQWSLDPFVLRPFIPDAAAT